MGAPLLFLRTGESSQQRVHGRHHAVVVASGIFCGLTRRHGPQKVVSTRSSALDEDLPRALQIGHPWDSVPQLLLLVQSLFFSRGKLRDQVTKIANQKSQHMKPLSLRQPCIAKAELNLMRRRG